MSESSDGVTVEEIEPADLVERRLQGESWQLLDVREPWEIELASIEGSININMTEIVDRHHELDVSSPVAVVCHSGARSRRVAEFLALRGYSRVANISGGIDAWSTDVDPSILRY